MVHPSVVNDQIEDLKKEVSNFENHFNKATVTKNICCNTDCYCRKQGNHKVTSSLYHKNCISMKKSAATVKKTDLIHPRSKSTERKEVFHLNDKARVEVTLKSSNKGFKIDEDRIGKRVENLKEKVKFVDAGCDPITILKPKKPVKKCWSAVLSEKSSSNIRPTVSQIVDKVQFVPSEKVKTNSTASSSPQTLPSLSVDGGSLRSKQSIVVKDRGIQCQQSGSNVINQLLETNPSSSPVLSLHILLNDLINLKKKLNGKGDASGLSSIISSMNLAVNKLSQVAWNDEIPLKPSAPEPSNNKLNSDGRKFSSKKGDGNENLNPPLKELEKSLEETCYQLQLSCLKLEETCQKLRKEKDSITEEFFEKSRELEKCLKRELEYQVKLNEANQSVDAMSQKLDQYTRSMEDLSIHVKKLQAENKALQKAEDEKASLIRQLMEVSRENEKKNSEIRMMTLEREKNKVLLEVKDQELAKLKSELRSIGGLVSEKMLETMMTGDSSILFGSKLELSESKELAFSSPDGSLTSPSKSWKAMSSIISPTRPRKPLPPPVTVESKRGGPDNVERKNPLESINHLKNELRELFAQMKQQTELSETILPDASHQPVVEPSPWSTVTDSSDGYNSITENELSEVT